MFKREIDLLNQLGLNDSEAKVYIALLSKDRCSGYEASKLSSVSKTKIYMILESLIAKGFVIFEEVDELTKYTSVPFSIIAERVRKSTADVLQELEESLKNLGDNVDLNRVWHIKGYSNIIAKGKELIHTAESGILMQVWEEDIPNFIDELQEAESRGIEIGLVVFTSDEELELPLKKFYRHGLLEEKLEEMGGRWLTLTIDQQEMIFGQLINGHATEALWTMSSPLIRLASECVRHDMYFYRSANLLKEQMKDVFGDDYKGIRNI